ncbi:MAG: prolipoprotein diacylglyceryl transferase [Proteobacteria bacterium]|nr:prolipoprotein diacylglyceryl transferase [Pseudomonadota bacterium]
MDHPQVWHIHSFDPIAFTIAGESVPWYWLNYLIGFIWCWFWLNKLANRSDSLRNVSDITAFAAWGWIGMLLGARLIYILLYNLAWYTTNPNQILAIWNGGMSFHGGLIGIALSSWLVATLRRTDLLIFTDLLAVIIPWPLATGRICNFINGELPGRPTGVSWAVIFPKPWDDFPRHPSQLYEAFAEGIILGLLMLWAWPHWRDRKGALSAVFLAGYGSLRFLTEFTREPDPQLGLLLGLTLGQILCLVMIACGAFMAQRIQENTTQPKL